MNGSGPLRVALCQMNPVVGDITGNEALIAGGLDAARETGAELVVFPELALSGYPPEDLLFKEHFLRDCERALGRIAARARDVVALVGTPERAEDVYNGLAVLGGGELHGIYRKCHLPNYGVFDEHRYFRPGAGGALIELGDLRIGLTVCEDLWVPGPPASSEALAGATLIVNASASPYHAGKGSEREAMLAQRARDGVAAIAFCAAVGGQDELVFDGHSLVIDHTGATLARGRQFAEDLLVADIDVADPGADRLRDTRHRHDAPPAEVPVLARLERPARRSGPHAAPAPPARMEPTLEPAGEIYAALVLGVRDYALKNGFEHAVLGLSGGVDSALVALVAVDALGPRRTSVAVMPSPYSSGETQRDARALAANLGIECLDLDIAPAMSAYDATLAEAFAGREPDITEENLQARIRGNLLMALSNKFGWLVLTTGNKSEMSVGYSTLYGDSAGGFAVLKDVFKTRVYELVRHREAAAAESLVPAGILERAPSAELRPGQRDADSLPPYPVLDAILALYVEEEMGREAIVARGHDRDVVERVIRLVDRAEYKRRQQPPGIRISQRAFGRDRRMPITNRYGG